MRLRSTLLAFCGLAALVHAYGIWHYHDLISWIGSAVAYAALAVLVAVSRGPVPLLVGVGVLAIASTVLAVAAGTPAASGGWFAYEPFAGPSPRQVADVFAAHLARETVPVVGYGALALAVVRLPARRRLEFLLAGLITMVATGVWVASGVARGAVTATEALAMVAGPLLLAALLLVATTVATQRVQPVLVAGGLALVTVAALSALDPEQFQFVGLGIGNEFGAALGSVWYWLGGGIVMRPYSDAADVLSPVLAFAQIAGTALVTVGVLRARAGAASSDGGS